MPDGGYPETKAWRGGGPTEREFAVHASSMENMKRCIDWYLPEGPVRVIDLGAMDVNGSYKALLP